jgi:hypothetical protein
MVSTRDETRKNGRGDDQANIGVVRYDFRKTDLHPQVAEGDGRTLISIGGWIEVQVHESGVDVMICLRC